MLVDTTGAPFNEPWKLLKDLDLGSKAYVLTQGFSLYSFQHKMGTGSYGSSQCKLWISGGIDEYEIPAYAPMVEGFGVGTKIVNAPVFDFALKIVEVDGEPKAKFSNTPGHKNVGAVRVMMWFHCGIPG